MSRLLPFLFPLLVIGAQAAQAQESFRVELGRDGETIGDMRPVFLEFKTQPMPAISPVEVARRYQKLFDNAEEPEVRIDALSRLSNIQRLTDEDVSISQQTETSNYREAIASYEAIINKGSYYGNLDELLYQMAKAHAFVGQMEASTDRLKQLVGLYPNSDLVPEARFRIAESAFSSANYAEAESEYGRLISGKGGDDLKTKARYMMGWSQYKQGPTAWRRAADSFLTVLGGFSDRTAGFTEVASADAGLIEDTFRIMALMAAEAEGVESIAEWSEESGSEVSVLDFSHLLYDRLADLYATRGDYSQSDAVNHAYIAEFAGHPSTPGFYAQSVDVWRMAGQPGKVRRARADFVAAYSDPDRYTGLNSGDQQLWKDFTKRLADYHYDQGETADSTTKASYFTTAAEYYEQLATRQERPGETLRLAGDASLQAGLYERALSDYRQAAYGAKEYDGAADAGWAALLIERNALDGQYSLNVPLGRFADSAQQWAERFPTDSRVAGLSSDVANRLLADGRAERAATFASAAIDHPASDNEIRYSAHLVMGETHVINKEFGLAENAWRKALKLAGESSDLFVSGEELQSLRRQLATSIYRQGENAADAGKTDIAVAHFQRIDSALPGSDIAIKGRYDAANTLLRAERWLAAVNELSRFRQDFPSHSLSASIGEKLVFAYVSSDQPVRAADELMSGSGGEEPPMTDQLRAAELYHEAGATDKRNSIYLAFLSQDPDVIEPRVADEHLRNQMLRQRLIESDVSATQFREDMVASELGSQWHSEETLNWSGQAALSLAEIEANRFAAVELRVPLADSLGRKQRLLEAARTRYEQAQQFGGDSVISRATYERAELYRQLAKDLMASEPPPELSELEAMQYQMLLEEEAYPFEEQAISMHEKNHQRLADGVFDQWVEQSLQVLATLFPGRYSRSVRWMTRSNSSEETNDDA
ncbi:outer membrane protein assembly factor BamD [Marinobacter sp. CHS3-4]|uniref:outer membrane protein assembly factor BamD n=1 Tax=Marinobacter sp. CHS3-4 TaxID=3045174 RepID=UPI0024B5B7AB|nr:outer membrane protein assembly factor BamD [Marinobacter sp. CHS3-4]MDI9245543.1 outer membrane protein assembly factor BamD [Marinobacter sp. CHS3-4]